jgi:hypothetical protein
VRIVKKQAGTIKTVEPYSGMRPMQCTFCGTRANHIGRRRADQEPSEVGLCGQCAREARLVIKLEQS